MAYIPLSNQSVSGTVGASIIGLPPIKLGDSTNASVITVGGAVANQSVSGTVNVGNFPGSVAAWLNSSNASVITVGSPVANQSVSGAVSVSNFPTTQNVSGSVVAFGFPTNQNVSGSVVAFVSGTPNVNVAGSVVAFVSGTVPVNAAGSVVAFQGTSPWVVNFQNSSVITQIGTRTTSLVSTVPSSVIVGASIFGQLPAGTAVLGSVAALQGTLPWAIAGSVAATISGTPNVNTAGSVVAFQGTAPWVVQSIVGTFAEDAAHTSADKGIFVLGVRNDAVASFVSADLEYSPHATDSAGRTVIKPFAPEDGTIISYTGSVVSASVTLIQASAIGKRSYITDFWVTNTGSVAQLITFQGGDTSIVGYTIAPAGGGSNSPGIAIPLKTTASQDLAFKTTGTSSIVYMTVKGYQAP